MTREEFYKLTDILNSEVLGNFMYGGEAEELIAMFEEAIEHSNILKQEEPVSKVWHNMIEEAENGRNIIIIDPKDFYGAVLRKGGTQLKNHNKERYVKWAYIDDIINVTNKEEPVSEELEEAAHQYAIESYPDEPSIGQFGTGDYEPYVDMSGQRECAVEDFKAGAQWQKEKDAKIWEEKEVGF